MSARPPLTERQDKALRLVHRILRDNFSNHVVIADIMKIDDTNYTTWGYAGNLNAVLGMMERYKAAIHRAYSISDGSEDEG